MYCEMRHCSLFSITKLQVPLIERFTHPFVKERLLATESSYKYIRILSAIMASFVAIFFIFSVELV